MSTYQDNQGLDRQGKSTSTDREYHEYTQEKDGMTYKVSVSKEGNKFNVRVSC
jgi:hypothetical protein